MARYQEPSQRRSEKSVLLAVANHQKIRIPMPRMARNSAPGARRCSARCGRLGAGRTSALIGFRLGGASVVRADEGSGSAVWVSAGGEPAVSDTVMAALLRRPCWRL